MEVGVGYGAGGVGEGVGAGLGLGEGDDLADVLLPHQQGGQAVQAHREAGVGRGAVAEGVEQEAEALLSLVGGDPQHLEDALPDPSSQPLSTKS